ncbi:repetitive organellar protein isoform X1 [Parasteatoda tepidariorum]|uniref:repetitive organellar protein isoform X1 n=1 Tax=Parasteatoda tepidariorum TaxID=114398 RepID=UPI00077FCB0D
MSFNKKTDIRNYFQQKLQTLKPHASQLNRSPQSFFTPKRFGGKSIKSLPFCKKKRLPKGWKMKVSGDNYFDNTTYSSGIHYNSGSRYDVIQYGKNMSDVDESLFIIKEIDEILENSQYKFRNSFNSSMNRNPNQKLVPDSNLNKCIKDDNISNYPSYLLPQNPDINEGFKKYAYGNKDLRLLNFDNLSSPLKAEDSYSLSENCVTEFGQNEFIRDFNQIETCSREQRANPKRISNSKVKNNHELLNCKKRKKLKTRNSEQCQDVRKGRDFFEKFRKIKNTELLNRDMEVNLNDTTLRHNSEGNKILFETMFENSAANSASKFDEENRKTEKLGSITNSTLSQPFNSQPLSPKNILLESTEKEQSNKILLSDSKKSMNTKVEENKENVNMNEPSSKNNYTCLTKIDLSEKKTSSMMDLLGYETQKESVTYNRCENTFIQPILGNKTNKIFENYKKKARELSRKILKNTNTFSKTVKGNTRNFEMEHLVTLHNDEGNTKFNNFVTPKLQKREHVPRCDNYMKGVFSETNRLSENEKHFECNNFKNDSSVSEISSRNNIVELVLIESNSDNITVKKITSIDASTTFNPSNNETDNTNLIDNHTDNNKIADEVANLKTKTDISEEGNSETKCEKSVKNGAEYSNNTLRTIPEPLDLSFKEHKATHFQKTKSYLETPSTDNKEKTFLCVQESDKTNSLKVKQCNSSNKLREEKTINTSCCSRNISHAIFTESEFEVADSNKIVQGCINCSENSEQFNEFNIAIDPDLPPTLSSHKNQVNSNCEEKIIFDEKSNGTGVNEKTSDKVNEKCFFEIGIQTTPSTPMKIEKWCQVGTPKEDKAVQVDLSE